MPSAGSSLEMALFYLFKMIIIDLIDSRKFVRSMNHQMGDI